MEGNLMKIIDHNAKEHKKRISVTPMDGCSLELSKNDIP